MRLRVKRRKSFLQHCESLAKPFHSKSDLNTKRGTKKSRCLTLPKLFKRTYKRLSVKSYPKGHIDQILQRPIIICGVGWHMVSLKSSSTHTTTPIFE